MGSPKESLEQKNVFTEKYDEIRRLDGTWFRQNKDEEKAKNSAVHLTTTFS
jgi:hypothetical protein